MSCQSMSLGPAWSDGAVYSRERLGWPWRGMGGPHKKFRASEVLKDVQGPVMFSDILCPAVHILGT